MIKSLAMLFFMLSVTMFSIGLYRYLMQFDTTVPKPYPPLETPADAETQRKYVEFLERSRDDDDEADYVVTRHTTIADTRDMND